MAIDLEREPLLTFNDAAPFLAGEMRPSYPTWWRWWRHGVRGVRLETVLVGGRRYTTAAAVQRFVVATTAITSRVPLGHRTPIQRNRDERRDACRLETAGITTVAPGSDTARRSLDRSNRSDTNALTAKEGADQA